MEPSPELIDGIRKLGNYNQIYTNNTPLVTVAGVPLLMHEAALAEVLREAAHADKRECAEGRGAESEGVMLCASQ